MYQNPVLFAPTTNREDFLCTVSLFDDDTGQALDLSGRTLAGPGDFAGNAWTVTCGNIITASVTALTIKDYPIGNEMQAIACVAGVGLAIAAGAPVTIADPTGKNTMTGYVTSYAPATGALVCQIGYGFEFEIREQCPGDTYSDGYGPSYFIGTDSLSAPIIAAQLGNFLTIVDVGVVQIRIPLVTMKQLARKTYGAAMTLFNGAPDTRQLFLGKLPILYGGVN